MQSNNSWKAFFTSWPKDLLPQGILVSTLNEQIPFKAFMLSKEMVLLDRTNPDPLGSRIILVPYDQIALVKLTSVVQGKTFEAIGFVGQLSGK